jgi:hypothetical protein
LAPHRLGLRGHKAAPRGRLNEADDGVDATLERLDVVNVKVLGIALDGNRLSFEDIAERARLGDREPNRKPLLPPDRASDLSPQPPRLAH